MTTPEDIADRPDVLAFASDIEQAIHDSGVGADEIHPIELAARLTVAGYEHRPDAPTPTPAGDDREPCGDCLARGLSTCACGYGESPTPAPTITRETPVRRCEATKTTRHDTHGWYDERGDVRRCPGSVGPSAPTVTTEQDVRAAGRRALDAYEAIPYDNDLTDEQVWDLLGRAALGIEVTP